MLDILVVCEHNVGRSQIAYEYLKEYGGDKFNVECAGLDPLPLNPLVVEIMKEEGFNISNIDNSYSVIDLIKLGRQYDVIITVCSRESDALCPVFPGKAMRLNWPYADPSKLSSDREERSRQIREMRDGIKSDVLNFVHAYDQMGLGMLLRSANSKSTDSRTFPKLSIAPDHDEKKSYLLGGRGNSPSFIDGRYSSKR